MLGICTQRFIPRHCHVQVLIPSVDPSERLLFSHTTLPGVYRTVMRYGYMDRVEHDAAFTNKIVEQARLSLLSANHCITARVDCQGR